MLKFRIAQGDLQEEIINFMIPKIIFEKMSEIKEKLQKV
jgi:hypothetical protein